MIRKENKENADMPVHGKHKDRKYSDEGRDGDYTKDPDSSMEEGDEDYDDEEEGVSFNKEETKNEKEHYAGHNGNMGSAF